MKRVLSALAVGLVAASLAACGGVGGGQSGYEEQVNEVGVTLLESFDAMNVQAGTSPAELADQLGSARSALDEAAVELGAMTPPAEVAEIHRTLVQGVAQLAIDFGSLEAALEQATDDPTAVLDALYAFGDLDSIAAIDEAMSAFAEHGYSIR